MGYSAEIEFVRHRLNAKGEVLKATENSIRTYSNLGQVSDLREAHDKAMELLEDDEPNLVKIKNINIASTR